MDRRLDREHLIVVSADLAAGPPDDRLEYSGCVGRVVEFVTGVPAAIGNAIFHATGRRSRDLPFAQDKLL